MGPTTGAPLATLVGSADGWAALLPDGSYQLSGDPGGLWSVAGLSRFEPRELDNLPSSCPPCGGCPTMERTDATEPTAVVADTVDLLTGILLAHPVDSPPRQLVDHFDIPVGAVLLGDGVRPPRAEGLITAFDRVPPDRFPSFDDFAAAVMHDPSTTPAEPDASARCGACSARCWSRRTRRPRRSAPPWSVDGSTPMPSSAPTGTSWVNGRPTPISSRPVIPSERP